MTRLLGVGLTSAALAIRGRQYLDRDYALFSPGICSEVSALGPTAHLTFLQLRLLDGQASEIPDDSRLRLKVKLVYAVRRGVAAVSIARSRCDVPGGDRRSDFLGHLEGLLDACIGTTECRLEIVANFPRSNPDQNEHRDHQHCEEQSYEPQRHEPIVVCRARNSYGTQHASHGEMACHRAGRISVRWQSSRDPARPELFYVNRHRRKPCQPGDGASARGRRQCARSSRT